MKLTENEMMVRLNQAAYRIGVRLFVVAALVSFGLNGYHWYRSQINLEHMEYMGSGKMAVDDQEIEMSVYKEFGADEVFLPNMTSPNQHVVGCVDFAREDGQTVAVNILGHRFEKTSVVTIEPYGLADAR